MPLTPPAARPWLGPDSRNRPWPGHGAMMIRRAEALGDLSAALGSWSRLGLAALAWALGAGGAVLVGRGVADGGSSSAVGIGLLLVATVLGGVLVATGSALARATAAWLTLATAVRADGGRVDATTADPDTLRAHEEAVRADRASGAGELWRPPLLARTVAVVLLTAATVVLAVQAVLGYGEASTPYAADDVRGEWLTRVLLALVCWVPALLTASGLRRVHRARMHRVAHDEPAGTGPGTEALTPALGSGAIVVGGVPGRPAAGDPVPSPQAGATAPPPAPAGPPTPPTAEPTPPTASEPAAPAHGHAPAPEAGPAVAASPRLRLTDGREVAPGVTLVGRAPRRRSEEHVDALLAVADEQVSKTHLTVRVEDGRVVVEDRGSTNGTVVHRPDGSVLPLREGEPHELAGGDVVVLGSTTLTLGEPSVDVEHTVLRHHDG